MFNGLLQTPIPIAGIQFYGEAGGGVYHETLSVVGNPSETNFGTQHRRRREDLAGRSAAPAARLPRVHVEGQPAAHERAAAVCGIEPEVLEASTYLAAAVALIATASFKLTSVWPSTKQSM